MSMVKLLEEIWFNYAYLTGAKPLTCNECAEAFTPQYYHSTEHNKKLCIPTLKGTQ